MPYKDVEMRRAAKKRHYEKNKNSVISRVRNRRDDIKGWWRKYKETLVCWHCGENSPECIDLHHVVSTGKKNARDSAVRWVREGWSKDRILAEVLATCVPLCCNCHRKVHAMHKRILREQQQAAKSDILERDTVGV